MPRRKKNRHSNAINFDPEKKSSQRKRKRIRSDMIDKEKRIAWCIEQREEDNQILIESRRRQFGYPPKEEPNPTVRRPNGVQRHHENMRRHEEKEREEMIKECGFYTTSHQKFYDVINYGRHRSPKVVLREDIVTHKPFPPLPTIKFAGIPSGIPAVSFAGYSIPPDIDQHAMDRLVEYRETQMDPRAIFLDDDLFKNDPKYLRDYDF